MIVHRALLKFQEKQENIQYTLFSFPCTLDQILPLGMCKCHSNPFLQVHFRCQFVKIEPIYPERERREQMKEYFKKSLELFLFYSIFF